MPKHGGEVVRVLGTHFSDTIRFLQFAWEKWAGESDSRYDAQNHHCCAACMVVVASVQWQRIMLSAMSPYLHMWRRRRTYNIKEFSLVSADPTRFHGQPRGQNWSLHQASAANIIVGLSRKEIVSGIPLRPYDEHTYAANMGRERNGWFTNFTIASSNGNIFRVTGPFVQGIHRSPVNSPHKGQWRGALMFSLVCVWINELSKQWWGWWFETPSRPLWRRCNVHEKTPWSSFTHTWIY